MQRTAHSPQARAKVTAPIAAAIAALAVVSSASARATTYAPGDYVAPLGGSDSFVALLLGAHGGIRAYVSDTHDIAERFAGNADARSFDATSKHGYRLHVTLVNGRASGTVRFPSGARYDFSALPVAKPGSLYRILLGPPERPYLGGWIVWDASEALGHVVASPSTHTN
jgi:hypothetical protein